MISSSQMEPAHLSKHCVQSLGQRIYQPMLPYLNHRVNKFQHTQLVLAILCAIPYVDIRLGPNDKKETGIPPVNDFVSSVLKEGTLQLGTTQALSDDFRLQGCPFIQRYPFVIGRETSLSLLVSGTSKCKYSTVYLDSSRPPPSGCFQP